MQRVGHRRFGRLVVLRPRAFDELARHEEPADAFGQHDERAQIGVRRAVGGVVGRVADPPLAVPGDPDARRIPRPPLRVGRAAVVQDAPVGRPAERPFRIAAEPARIGIRSALREVAGARVHADVEPVARKRRAVGSRVEESRELLARAHHHVPVTDRAPPARPTRSAPCRPRRATGSTGSCTTSSASGSDPRTGRPPFRRARELLRKIRATIS